MKDIKLFEIVEDILNDKKISLNVRDFKSFKKLKLDTDTSTITGAGKGEPTGADNSVQCADAQKIFDIIKLWSSC